MNYQGNNVFAEMVFFKKKWIFGNDIQDPHLLNGTFYCNNKNQQLLDFCNQNAGTQAENKTQTSIAGAFSIFSVFFSLISWILSVVVLSNRKNPNFGSQISFIILVICLFQTLLYQTISIYLVSTSPHFKSLFSNYGCNFTLIDSLNSNPLRCKSFGVSYMLAIFGCITCLFACLIFFLCLKKKKYSNINMHFYSLLGATIPEVDSLNKTDFHDQFHNTSLQIEKTNENHEEKQDIQQTRVSDRLINNEPIVSSKSLIRSLDAKPLMLRSSLSNFSIFIKSYFLPLVCVMNIMLYIWSACSTGASIETNVSIKFSKYTHFLLHKFLPHRFDNTDTITVNENVFDFTMFSSLKRFFSSKSYLLFCVILFFSGLWPYIGSFLLIFLWFVPTTESFHERVLFLSRFFSKFSLINVYIILFVGICFDLKATKEINNVLIDLGINLRPGWGILSFTFASLMLLINTQIFSFIHLKIKNRLNPASQSVCNIENEFVKPIYKHSFISFPSKPRYSCSNVGLLLLSLLIVISFILILVLFRINLVEFDFSGVATIFIPQEMTKKKYQCVIFFYFRPVFLPNRII